MPSRAILSEAASSLAPFHRHSGFEQQSIGPHAMASLRSSGAAEAYVLAG